jgi:hypothetical protein
MKNFKQGSMMQEHRMKPWHAPSQRDRLDAHTKLNMFL